MENKNMWKSVAVSVFWILLAMFLVGYCYEQAMVLMSKPSTLCFYSGIMLIAFSVMVLAIVCERQHRKYKLANQKSPKEEQGGKVPKGENTDDGK